MSFSVHAQWWKLFLLLEESSFISLSLSLLLLLLCYLYAVQEKLMGLAAKEAEKRAAFLAQMGLKPGQKITIQPRQDV